MLERRTLQEQVFLAVRGRIIRGQLLPGTRILETEESARLGVSRGTLREALRQLEQEGLVVRDPRRVVYVKKLTTKEIVDLYSVRGALEVLAARAICDLAPRRRRRVAGELREYAERLALAEAEGSADEEVSADLSFHGRLCELSGNTILLSQWRGLAALIGAMLAGEHQRLSLSWSRTATSIPEHHLQIVEAFDRGDFESVSTSLVEGFTKSVGFLVRARPAATIDRSPQ